MVGQRVGKYRILEKLGRGGMGTVYRAVDEMLHRDVAIKVLSADLGHPEVARRFRAEAITVARLSHPGIAGIYELFEHDGEWLMVMEFVRGETLESMVNHMGPLSAKRAAELCMQTLAVLAYAHSMGVVHRDLKPANLMITESGAVKVMDFGIARVSGAEHLTNAGFMMGTPAYMAPEQVRGGEIDARADLYALGVVFYRLTTATLPFKGDSPFAMAQSQVLDPPTPVGLVRPDLPQWVGEVVARALAKTPDQRFQSAAEFHEALARCLAGLPLSSMYASGDPLTPGRPVPTGGFQMRPTPTPIPMPSGQVQVPGANDQTMMATPVRTTTSPAAASAAGVRTTFGMGLMVGAAIVVVAGSIAAVVMLGDGRTDELPPIPVAAGVSPPPAPAFPDAPPVVPPTESPGPAVTTGSAGPTGPATPAATAPVRAATPPVVKADGTAEARGTSAASGPTTGRAAAPPSRDDDPLVTFPDVKLYTVTTGKETDDRDALLNFAGGQLLVMPESGGAAMATLPYRSITRATYVKARDPKWDPTLPAPPEGVDVGSFMRQGRHWLVLQGPDHYAILRLEDDNFTRILSTLEERTGVKVDRPKSD